MVNTTAVTIILLMSTVWTVFTIVLVKKSGEHLQNTRLIKNYKRHKFLDILYDFKIEFVELFGDKK
jgi:hypothetical protein